ncbi:hypothetical protein G6F43_009672 [Rhizopus delemar]|nr:hypothetical protein G6F43_009672 [Rhizopus delemar]
MKKNDYEPYFVPGEEELVAMTVQLKRMGVMVNKRQIYRADGVVRLAAIKDLEVVVLETAGPFGSDDRSKIAFDNSKGMFALLAMLKTIADMFKYASTDEFKKLKLYFVQISDKYLRLWSMNYSKNGLYDFLREEKIVLSEEFIDRDKHPMSLIKFFLSFRTVSKEQ